MKKMIARNKQAKRNYEIETEYEAGVMLIGSEVKSLREGRASLNEAYCKVRNNECFLVGAHITEYRNAGYAGHEPTRERKLLLHKHEIKKIAGKVIERGYTLVPMELYWSGAHVKLLIGLGKGKRTHDKRRDVSDRDAKRAIARALKEANQ